MNSISVLSEYFTFISGINSEFGEEINSILEHLDFHFN